MTQQNISELMQTYIGTKLVKLFPMTRGEYNDYRGWAIPEDECGSDLGYLVEYLDGGKPNHPKHPGYISWSPKEQADRAYKPLSSMTFGDALVALKAGKKVARSNWTGKGRFLFLIPGFTLTVDRPPLLGIYPEGAELNHHAYIAMRTADNKIVPWLCSQTDALAEDWVIVD